MKFRRKSEQTPSPADEVPAETTAPQEQSEAGPTGPYDAEGLDDGVERIDIGALLVAPAPGLELRLQVNEESGEVASALLAGPEGAMELQVFSAPRNGDLWGEVRPQIAADVVRRGGTATEREGRWGTELECRMPVQRPDGTQAVQPSRVIGINGSRWLLRASLLGRPAFEDEAAQVWEDALASVAVRRGDQAMPVGRPIGFTLPPDARRAT
ncbi:DUF3710 domain-containing protein [Nocardioides campestrisoli]|uniref:DUF3710 domain-containing protein n=1 Tax=Nocardioides campestrisoli TaxID=2736757 RepID=UPI0015E6C909|nr:DUF3710 domain-containing protein [Nocardioides campestrisoli]